MAVTRVYVPRVSHPPTLTSPRDPPRVAGSSGPGSYQITASALGPGACEILCSPFNSEVSFPPQSYGTPEIKPCWLSKPMVLGAHLPGAGRPGWGA